MSAPTLNARVLPLAPGVYRCRCGLAVELLIRAASARCLPWRRPLERARDPRAARTA